MRKLAIALLTVGFAVSSQAASVVQFWWDSADYMKNTQILGASSSGGLNVYPLGCNGTSCSATVVATVANTANYGTITIGSDWQHYCQFSIEKYMTGIPSLDSGNCIGGRGYDTTGFKHGDNKAYQLKIW